MDISVREVERHLDTYLFLDEYPRWESGGPHCPYILQWMFAHMGTAGWKVYDHGIWWGCQQSMPKQDASMEAPAINLIGYQTTQEEIIALYHEVYQLKRAPRTVPHDPKRWKRPTRRSLTQWRSISGICGVLSSWGNQSKDQLAHQGPTNGLISSGECRRPMTKEVGSLPQSC